jgi:hypothetical protein
LHTQLAIKLTEQALVSDLSDVRAHQAIEALLANKVSFDGAVLWSIRSGSLKLLAYFIERYPDMVTRVRTPKTQFSPLVLAVMHQQPDMVKALCNMGYFPELYVLCKVPNLIIMCSRYIVLMHQTIMIVPLSTMR